ncbi:MAG: hypothetical protein HYX84_08450 [Chloroflexi bacterium]|nr:hypothetical protein [Chloroflexota bacterium]
MNRLVTGLLMLFLLLGLVACAEKATAPASEPAPPTPPPAPVSSSPTGRFDPGEGSPPPAGIGGWQKPRPLTEDEKASVVRIAVSSPQVSAWLQGRTDYRTAPIRWYAIVWNETGGTRVWSSHEYKIVDEDIPDYSPGAYWYPGVTLAIGEGTIYQMIIAVDLDAGKVAMTDGPLPSLDSPDRFRRSTPKISQEEAIEIASRTLPPSLVDRADIRAELHGWYWEIVFDNLNAEADELMPWPLKGPPPPPPGQPAADPYPGIWQSVIATVDAETGFLGSMGARKTPEPGPYVSQEQAIQSAREFMLRTFIGPSEVSWLEKAKIGAYLRGDTWMVLFWEDGQRDMRFYVTVNAVSGVATGASRGSSG